MVIVATLQTIDYTEYLHMKRALITGVTGQDGYYLSKLLLSKGYDVYALVRRTSNDSLIRFVSEPETLKKIKVIYGNLRDTQAVRVALTEAAPDEIYNLAALSDVGVSFKCPDEAWDVNYEGLGRLVNEAIKINPSVRIYQASTSEMFGKTEPPQNENSPFQPVSPYAEAKLKAHEDFIKGYREQKGIFTCSGILFNHESPVRGENFVTRKITLSLAKIKEGLLDHVELGNMDAKRDWGFAGDYVEAMWLMLQQEKPDDYVIGTNESHSVREFFEYAAQAMGIEITWEGKGLDEVAKDQNGKVILRINPKFYRPVEVHALRGDYSKAKNVLGWEPKTSFKKLVQMMAVSDLKKIADIKESLSI
jgi:GDPmannose 4,6-dehydratase